MAAAAAHEERLKSRSESAKQDREPEQDQKKPVTSTSSAWDLMQFVGR